MSKETTGTAQVSGATPQKQALLDAFDTVLKKQAEEREAEQRAAEARRLNRGRIRPAVLALAGLAFALCGYLYFERPDWLFPRTTPPEPIAITDASLRIGMGNVAQHIERYRQRTGKLPATLADAGAQMEGVSYQLVDSSAWRLSGTHGGVELTLTSQDQIRTFIGNSFEQITRRSR